MRSYTAISMIKYSPRKWLPHTGRVERRRRVLLSIAAGCALCIIVLASYNAAIVSSSHSIKSIFSSLFPNSAVDHPVHEYVQCCDEDGINFSSSGSATCNCEDHHVSFARFAYLIGGVRGEEDRVWRVLRAVYHPLNQYVIHLEASDEDISAFAVRLTMDPVYSNVGNVIMMMKADRITYSGPTMVANTLHAAAILLRQSKKWNWFVNLSPSDYPLVSQDDLIYAFTSIQRNLSFIDNTKELGGKMEGRGQRVIIDPGLYMKNKSKAIIMTPERRPVPDAFTLYTGSAWLVLSRAFMEFCISGWDNLPRELLMYHANIVITTEFYFQTVICNSEEFMPTVINHDMHFILWSYPHPGQHPITLSMTHLNRMIASNAPFARKFGANDPVLDVIDSQYLGRNHSNGFTYGGWCSGFPPCSQVGNITHLVPGPGAKRLQSLMDRVLTSYENKCSAWWVLSRSFMEFCIWGWDNLPRLLLLFHADVVVSTEFYFQTASCNSEEFMPTAVNQDMRFTLWDYPQPGKHPIALNKTHLERMVASNAAFARKFKANDPVVDVIDPQYLGRSNHSNGFTYGGWSSGFPTPLSGW